MIKYFTIPVEKILFPAHNAINYKKCYSVAESTHSSFECLT